MAIECLYCGETNTRNESFCRQCGAELKKENVPVISEKETFEEKPEQAKKILILENIRDKKIIEVRERAVIGRMGNVEPEYFRKSEYFSREQFIIDICDKITIEHLSHSTPTELNNIKLVHGKPVVIRNRSIIRVADMTFLATIKDISEEKKKSVKWVIKCCNCGKKYYGDTPDFHVYECNGPCLYSDDENKKYDIRKVKAVMEEE
ncbi:MAG: hypothetical protein J6J52_04965 [Oscillospiraceae bacterium]|nr:hypothetical protein [Oscillospiraceae bacterium]